MGYVISILGGKGGVGKSIFAANFALAFQKETNQSTLLIDLDFNSLGDQNIILGKKSPKNIIECSQFQGAMDSKMFGSHMLTHPSGIRFVSAPTEQTQVSGLNMEGLGKFIKSAATMFNYVIIDVGSNLDDVAFKAIEQSTLVFAVTNPDILVVNQTKKVISKIAEALFPVDMVQVILNKFNPSSIVTPAAIQKNLGKNLFAPIHFDPDTCASSLASGNPFVIGNKSSPMSKSYHDLVRKILQQNVLPKLATLNKPAGVKVGAGGATLGGASSGGANITLEGAAKDSWTALKLRVHHALVDQMDLKKTSTETKDEKSKALLKEKTRKTIIDILNKEETASILKTREHMMQIVKEIVDEALGLGPLEDLLADNSVTEIMVNSKDQIYIEKAGKPTMSPVTFSSDQQLYNVIERIVTPLGRRVDEKCPYQDARLEDGSRVHVIIPPLALKGPTITIRKFPKKRIEYTDLIKFGSMTEEIADFLRLCVEAKLNIVVSGGTGSGKTTLLNVLSNFIPSNERVITVEDSAELQLALEHVVRLETRPSNIEGEGEVSTRDLVKQCLRMRPERIVVGECRGGEALDMLQAMNTGHDGSLTTLHANAPRETIARLETLVMMAGMNLPMKAIREQIASSVHLIVQQSRLSDGSRKVTYITEVAGMQGDVVTLQDIFLYKQEGLDKHKKIVGRFVATGFVPKFVEDMEAKGMKISRNLFSNKG